MYVPSYASVCALQGQDLASGNLTAPVLFALEHETAGPELLVSIHSWHVQGVGLIRTLCKLESHFGTRIPRKVAAAV